VQQGIAWFGAWLALASMVPASAGAQAQPQAAPDAANAQPSAAAASAAPDPAPAVGHRWYGWQILATDASALALGLGIAAASGDHGNRRFANAVGSAWGLGMLGSLSVHAAHESSGAGLAGMGYRLMVPPVVSIVGLGFGCLLSGIADDCASDSARWSFAAGALATSALDIGLLARERRPAEPREWYGWQTLVIDGAALTAGVIVTVRRDEPDRRKRIAGLAVLPYVTGLLISPWVHAFHGRWGTALGSLALRAFAPALGVLAGLGGYCAASGGADECTADGAIYGLLAGTVLTATIDIGLMSHESSAAAPTRASGNTLAPYVAPHGDGLRTGIAGTL
jgi:hypothetical protein